MARDVRTVIEDTVKELGGFTSQQVIVTIGVVLAVVFCPRL